MRNWRTISLLSFVALFDSFITLADSFRVMQQRQLDDSTIVGRDQVINMSSEIAALRQQLDTQTSTRANENDSHLTSMQGQLDTKSAEMDRLRQEAESQLAELTSSLDAKHVESTRAIQEAHSALLDSVREEHATALSAALEDKKEALRLQGIEYAAALASLAASHATVLAERDAGHSAAVLARSTEFEESKSALEKLVALRESEKDTEMARLVQEHAEAFEELERTNASQRKELEERHAVVLGESAAVLTSKDSEHQLALENLAEVSLLSFYDLYRLLILVDVQQHALALSTSRQTAEADETNAVSTISKLLESHAVTLASLSADHSTALSALSTEHAQAQVEREAAQETLLEERTAAYLLQLTLVETERDAAKLLHQELAGRTSQLEKMLAVVTIERDELSSQVSDLVGQQNHPDRVENVTSSSRPSSYVPSVMMLPSRMSTTTMSRSEVADEDEEEGNELAQALRESQAEREALIQELSEMREAEGARQKDEDEHRRKIEEELARTAEERDRLSSELSRLSVSDGAHIRPTTPIMSLGFAGERSKIFSPSNSPSSALKAAPPTPPPSMPPPPLPLNNPRILFGPGSPSSDRHSAVGMMTGRKLSRADSSSSSMMTSIPQTVTEESTTASVRSTDSIMLGDSKLVKQLEEENQVSLTSRPSFSPSRLFPHRTNRR